MKALMTLVLVLLAAGCAAGEGGAGSTTTDKTTAHNAEETTVLTGAGNLPRPPESTLSYGGREVTGMLGSYCWSYRSSSLCADAFWPLIPSKQKTLTVPPDSQMVFRYGEQSPPITVEARAYLLNKLQKTGTMRPDHSLKAQGSGVQRTISAEMPPGEYVVDVFIREQQGDASYYFRVAVE